MKKLITFQSKTFQRYSQAISLAGGIFLILTVLLSGIVNPSIAKAITITPPRIDLDGDPGSKVSSEFKVMNEGSTSITYYTQVENFEAKDESGNPQFVQSKEGLATWISVPSSIAVAPGEKKTIPYTVNVPKNAEPGGYFASIFIRTTPPATSGGEVSIGARLGTLVLFRVNGDIQEGVNILEFSTKDKKRFYSSLPVELYYRFQNTGADRVKPAGDVIIKNILGMKAKILPANKSEGSVLPRSIRRFEMAWMNGGGGQESKEAILTPHVPGSFFSEAKYQFSHFAFGYYTANLDITFGQNNNTAKETFRFFVIPWQLLIIVVVGLALVVTILRLLLRWYAKRVIRKHSS